jgi:hypothetical protein
MFFLFLKFYAFMGKLIPFFLFIPFKPALGFGTFTQDDHYGG